MSASHLAFPGTGNFDFILIFFVDDWKVCSAAVGTFRLFLSEQVVEQAGRRAVSRW